MKYSIIVPTYNSEKWIQQCINSVLAQSLHDFELIILDSGSTDGTIEWIRSVTDSRIRLVVTSEPLGIVENWRRITAIPRNEFMTILGHDDVLYPDYLSTIDQLGQEYPAAGLYLTHFNFINGEGELIRSCASMNSTISSGELLEVILQNKIEITATGYMVRSKDYDKIGGIPAYPNLLYADIELWLRLVEKNFLAVSSSCCFDFRLHLANTSKSTGDFRLTAFEMLVDFLCRLKQEDANYKEVIERHGLSFLKNHVIGSCHKLLYMRKDNRHGVTMSKIIDSSMKCAGKLLPAMDFKPLHFPGIWLASLIDASPLLRSLFIFYKSFQKRTY